VNSLPLVSFCDTFATIPIPPSYFKITHSFKFLSFVTLKNYLVEKNAGFFSGFGDENSRIVAQLVSFFNSPERLTDVRASERVTQMFTDLLNPEDKAFLFIFPDLLLSLTEKSPDFLGKIYENPLVI